MSGRDTGVSTGGPSPLPSGSPAPARSDGGGATGEASLLILGLLVIGVLGWIDVVTGPEIGLSLFYLIPVAAAGWRLGRASVMAMALAASAAWLTADIMARETYQVPVSAWNGGTRLAIFTALGLLTLAVKRNRLELHALLERERLLARTDPLTGLANGRAFREWALVELARARRGGLSTCLVYFDLDDFKTINDAYGHAAGDEMLVRVASILVKAVRVTDLPTRLGGDEFAVLLTGVDRSDAEAVARRVITRVAEEARTYPRASAGMSAGAAYSRAPIGDPEQLLRTADDAMYEAKSAGKGQLVVRILEPCPAETLAAALTR